MMDLKMHTVDLHVSKAYKSPERAEVLRKLQKPMGVAQALADAIRERVAVEANPAREAGQAGHVRRPYESRARGFLVHEDYMRRLGLGDKPGRFASSAEFHKAAGIRPGTYKATSGLWSSLYVRNWGGKGAIIDFRGRSLGRRINWTKTREEIAKLKADRLEMLSSKRKKNGELTGSAKKKIEQVKSGEWESRYRKPAMVRNQIKAASIFKAHRLNILAPDAREMRTMEAAFADAGLRSIAELFGQDPSKIATTAQRQRKFYGALNRAFKGGR